MSRSSSLRRLTRSSTPFIHMTLATPKAPDIANRAAIRTKVLTTGMVGLIGARPIRGSPGPARGEPHQEPRFHDGLTCLSADPGKTLLQVFGVHCRGEDHFCV